MFTIFHCSKIATADAGQLVGTAPRAVRCGFAETTLAAAPTVNVNPDFSLGLYNYSGICVANDGAIRLVMGDDGRPRLFTGGDGIFLHAA